MSDPEAFASDLVALGFRAVQDRAGTIQFAREATPQLTYWVHWRPGEETVLFTWELAVGEFFDSLGMQIGTNEQLNQFLFPKHDARGPQDVSFVVEEMDRVEQILGSIRFV